MQTSMSCQAGSADRANEDWCGSVPGVSVVLDGVTSPGQSRTETPRYVSMLGNALLSLVSDKSRTLEEALSEAIKQTSKSNFKTNPAAAVGIVRTSDESFEYLLLADITLLATVDNETWERTDDRVEHVATEKYERTKLFKLDTDEHREAVAEMSTEQQEWRNQDGGYWVASAEPRAAHEARTGSIPRNSVRAFALLSDGAARLARDFSVMTWETMLSELAEKGPANLIKQTREAEHDDPQGTRWPRFKHSDDATCVYVDLQEETRRRRSLPDRDLESGQAVR